jgi:tRNA-splicing ligase RtcB
MNLVRLDPWRLRLERTGAMLVDAAVYASEKLRLEDESIRQLAAAASVPTVQKALATPDIHVGFGVPIGCVLATAGAVVPAAVGYDVNCGMRLLTTPLELSDVGGRLRELAHSIARDVPLGEGQKNVALSRRDFQAVLERGLAALPEVRSGSDRWLACRVPAEELADAAATEESGALDGGLGAVSRVAFERGLEQLGTLGGGNHFIEVQLVERVADAATASAWGLHAGQVVVMIHSGSRGLGHQVGGEYMKAAKGGGGRGSAGGLACLEAGSRAAADYIGAMNAAANFAFANRQIMAAFVRRSFRHMFGELSLPSVYDVPHNMAKLEEHGGARLWVHRKGATRAFPPSRMAGAFAATGQPVLIPGSMGTASYVLAAGESGAETLWSVNHGAGRVMSRTEAAGRRGRGGAVSEADFRRVMAGVELLAADRRGVYEEAPQAYKDIDAVIEVVAGAGLARVVARLKPLAVLKG